MTSLNKFMNGFKSNLVAELEAFHQGSSQVIYPGNDAYMQGHKTCAAEIFKGGAA